MAKTGKKSSGVRAEALAESPSHLLHRVLQRAVGIYAEEMGSETLTQRQYAVLTAASGIENPSQTDLVALTGIDRSTLAELVARMIDKGLLQRERSADDGRAKTVRLTEAGQAALGQARARVKAADKRILSLLPKPKREGFLKLLTRLADEPEKARKEKPVKGAKDKADTPDAASEG